MRYDLLYSLRVAGFIVTCASTYLIIYPSFCYVHRNYYLFCACSDHDITKQQQQQQQQKVSSPSLSQYFNKDNSKQNQQNNSDAVLGKENTSADLKALLPKQKMKFMKLDVSCFLCIMLLLYGPVWT